MYFALEIKFINYCAATAEIFQQAHPLNTVIFKLMTYLFLFTNNLIVLCKAFLIN